jgi:hypothetical protein
MTYRKNSTRSIEVYGISGGKGHGKDTFCDLILKHSADWYTQRKWEVRNQTFKVLHFADDLKKVASKIFGIPLDSFIDPNKKEVQFRAPIDLDLFVSAMQSETGLSIEKHGLVACSPREVMQRFGTEYVRGAQDDYWVSLTLSKVGKSKRVIIPDTRFVNELQGVLSIGGRIIEVLRVDTKTAPDTHSSETERSKFNPDLIVGVRTGDLSLPNRVARLIATGKFQSALRYDYRSAKKAMSEYQGGKSLEECARLLGENHKDPYCLKNILDYYGVPVRKKDPKRVGHKIIKGSPHKWCSACTTWAPLGEFNYNSKSWDSLAGLCRTCASVSNKDHYLKHTRKDTLAQVLKASKSSAIYRGIPFNLTLESVQSIWDKQEGKCFYSGQELTFEPGSIHKATLDRVDSAQGYIPENIVFCSYRVNMMKRDLTLDEFGAIVRKLSLNSESWAR